MELSPREATDLAAFFARRFPARAEVDELARTAGVELDDTLAGDHIAVWSTLIVEAQVQGRLRRLARSAARQDSDDDNLQEVCTILARGEGPSTAAILGGIGVMLAIVAFGVGAWLGLQPAQLEEAAPPAAVTTAEQVMLPQPSIIVAATAETEPVTAEPSAEQATEPATEPDPGLRTASIVSSPAATTAGRCQGTEGEIVGYWYGGRTLPGRAGQTITVAQSVNVRADYPDRHNGYDARTALRCGLKIGDRIKLSRDPIQVPGDAYWVPLVAGDLL